MFVVADARSWPPAVVTWACSAADSSTTSPRCSSLAGLGPEAGTVQPTWIKMRLIGSPQLLVPIAPAVSCAGGTTRRLGRADEPCAHVRSHAYDRYTVQEFPDGTLVLTPAVTISALERATLRDPAVRPAVADAKTGDRSKLRRRPAPGSHKATDLTSRRQMPRSRTAASIPKR